MKLAGKLTEAVIRKIVAPARGELKIWDGELRGLHIRVQATPGGAPSRVWVLRYRNAAGRQRRLRLGAWPGLSADKARTLARRAVGAIAEGGDPAGDRTATRQAGTIADLADRFLEEHVATRCKPSTAAEYRRLIARRIKPALGPLLVAGLTRTDLARFHGGMRDAPRSANQALDIVSAMLRCAEQWGLRPTGSNPARSVSKFPEIRRNRVLSDAELQRLGVALAALEEERAILPGQANAVRLLALTGCRLSEILRLRWTDVDLARGALALADSKTGPRVHAIGRPAAALLRRLHAARDSDLVCDGNAPGDLVSVPDIEVAWRRIRTRASLEDARMHDLRHTVATFAAETGANSFLIRDKLGHAGVHMSAAYVGRQTAPLRALSTTVETRIFAAMSGKARRKTARGGPA